MKFILAGCLLVFSLNTYASGTIEFFGFGAQSADKLCIVSEGESASVLIDSVYQQAKMSSEYVSYNCEQINLIGSPVESLMSACEGVDENLIVSKIDIDFLEPQELVILESVASCN